MFVVWQFAIAFVCAQSEGPPAPNFTKPVDYIGWYNAYVSKGQSKNALDAYKGFYAPDGNHPGIAAPDAKTSKQRDALCGHRWEPDEQPEVVTYLEANAKYLEIMKAASKKGSCWQPCPKEAKTLLHLTCPILAAS